MPGLKSMLKIHQIKFNIYNNLNEEHASNTSTKGEKGDKGEPASIKDVFIEMCKLLPLEMASEYRLIAYARYALDSPSDYKMAGTSNNQVIVVKDKRNNNKPMKQRNYQKLCF